MGVDKTHQLQHKTDLHGELLRAPLDIRAPVGWIGYANPVLRRKYEPVLLELLWG